MFGNLTSFGGSVFDELWRLQQEMDEIFGTGVSSGSIRSLPQGSFPAINVGLTPDKAVAYLFAPGIDPKDLNISIQQNLLTISGRRQIPADQKVTWYRQERFTGEFHRVVTLPEDVDPERVSAKYRDGIVQIEVQRRDSAKPRQIEIH